MEVLPPLTRFTAPLPPALFNEYTDAGSFNVATPNPSNPPPSPTPASSPECVERSSRFAKTSSPPKPVIGGFRPLPTIVASPVCTPTSSFPPSIETPQPPVEGVPTPDSDSTPPEKLEHATSPNSCMSLRILFPAAPTWMSTPPTPPKNPTDCSPRNLSGPVSPSASFPASTLPHVIPASPKARLKRCLSYPIMSPRSRAISEPALTSKEPHVPQLSEAFNEKKGDQFTCSKAVFHLSSDDEPGGEYAPSIWGHSPASSLNEHDSVAETQTQSTKDAVRICHALQELLTTELDYVNDLRVLLLAYIQRLPSFEARTSTFTWASASFSTGPWTNTYATAQVAQTLAPADGMTPSSSPSWMRPIFSDSEINLLTRNLKDILQIHEQFATTLQNLLSPLGFSDATGSVESPKHYSGDFSVLASALKAVAEKFVAESPSFEAYQTFCVGHSEAADLIRRVMSQHSADWESFEQHCSAVASELNNLRDGNPALVVKRSRSSLLEVPMAKTAEQRRRRTMSTISPGSKSPARWTKKVDCTSDSRRSRLVFMDYLIKPVQRICKYPLLLEQLKPLRPTFGLDEVNTAVENAIQVMRNVAASVDEARRKQEAFAKTSLIISRLVLPPPSSPLSPPSTPLDSNSPVGQVLPLHALTPSFLSSLGPCLLAGSLDVMCYSPRCSFGHLPSITAKYLGAFLYSGGYLILTKVHKGKKYEPRHWFSLADFEVAGVESDEAMLPCSFRLSSRDVHFELAAACQREKGIWLQAIQDSTKHKPTWRDVPLPSYKAARRGNWPVEPRTDASSIPAASDTESLEPSVRMDSRRRKLTLRSRDTGTPQDQSRPPSRRSSTASIKSIFAPMGHDPNSIYINRSVTSGRLQVDHDLQDVISQVCLSARLYARLHDEELFPQPPQRFERLGFSRSNSAISVASLAKNRLSKQESLKVPRRRARCDSMTAFNAKPHSEAAMLTSAPRNGKGLGLGLESSRPADVDLPCPSSGSSTSMSTAQSSSSTPTTISTPFSLRSTLLSRSVSPLSSEPRSSRIFLTRNVKEFFHFRTSQTNSLPYHNSRSDDASSSPLSRWRRSISRRRSRSTPYDDGARTPK